MNILLVDNYDSFSFNLVQAIRSLAKGERADTNVLVYRNDQISLSEVFAIRPSGIVISPGPGHPANPSDFGINTELILNQERLDCPVLGVCLGHQGIVQTLGGLVEMAPRIMHGKTSLLKQTGKSPLFDGIAPEFVAMRYHSLTAKDDRLPSSLTVTARDSETNSIMAIEHKERPIFGLQFHPESIGTPSGPAILNNFITICSQRGKRR